MHEHVRFVARLRIIELRAHMEARGAPRQIVLAGKLAHHEHHLSGFRRAAHGGARLHVHRHHELAVDHRRALADQLREGDTRQRLGIDLRHRAHRRGRCRGAAERKGGRDDRLVVRGIDAHGVEHRLVPDERRIAVGDRDHHGVVLDEAVTEDNARHLHHVLGAFLRGDDAHEGLVAIGEGRVDDVEVALRHRDFHGLAADRRHGVERRQHLREAVEVVEVDERAVAAHVVEVAHIGRAVHRNEDLVPAAHLHGTLGVPRMKGELRGRARNERHEKSTIDAHAGALYVGAGLLPQGGRLIVAELAAHLLEDLEGLVVDQFHGLVRQDLVGGNLAHKGGEGDLGRTPHGAAAVTASGAAGGRLGGGGCGVAHNGGSSLGSRACYGARKEVRQRPKGARFR